MDDNRPCYPLPTAQVQPYVDVLGVPLAIEFLLAFGGAGVRLSEKPLGFGMVEGLVGTTQAALLSRELPAIHRVPLANTWLAKCLYAQGLSIAAVARRLRITDVTVRRYLKNNNTGGYYGSR